MFDSKGGEIQGQKQTKVYQIQKAFLIFLKCFQVIFMLVFLSKNRKDVDYRVRGGLSP